MSFGVVEGEADAGADGLTVAEIDGHPFGEIRFTGQRWALADVRLLSPILPSKVVCVGRNYAEHAAELGNEVPKEPLLFLKPSTSVIGPNDAIRLPPQSKQVEHEAELAVVIGATGARRVDRAGAAAGHLRLHLRQRRHRARPAAPRRPVDPGQGLRLVLPDRARGSSPTSTSATSRCAARCNEEVRQLGRTKDMVFDVPTLVSYVSHVMTLLPGRRDPHRHPGRREPAHRRRHGHRARSRASASCATRS